MREQYNLLTGNINKVFLKYVLTSTTGMMMISMYILFDTIFIGQMLGKIGLSALNISIPIYNLLFATGILVGTGSATVISISLGNKKKMIANRAFSHSFLLGIAVGLLYSIIGLIYIDKIVNILGATPNNIVLVKEYLSIILPFSWSFVMVYNLSVIVRNDNGPRRAMVAMGLGGLTNVIFDYIFIFPLNMGMKGAAIATVMSSIVSLTILSFHFIAGHSSFKSESWKMDSLLISRIFKIGFPGFIVEVSSGIIIFLFNIELIRILGDIGVSAYSIIANIALMATAIFTGISQGMQPVASINYGAGNFGRVYMIRRLGVVLSIFIGFIFLTLGILLPELLISVFTSESGEIVNITSSGIKVYFFAFPIIGINVIMTGFFQSIEQTNYATLISLIRGPILSFLFLKLLTMLFGSTGIWLTTLSTEGLTLLIILLLLWLEGKHLGIREVTT